MTEDERHASSVSRRTMLKRIGIAGTVAWVTPVVTSLSTPAFAASVPTGGCSNVAACNFPVNQCGTRCTCVPTTEGTAFCHQGFTCGTTDACTSSSQCPEGWACTTTCCPGGTFCAPPCGTTNRQTAGTSTGATSIGR
jgi:hypothetical protein